MKTAWLVKVDYKVVKMKAFTSYESALKYYNQMVDNIEVLLKGRDYEKQCTNLHSRPLITEFKQYDEEYKHVRTLGLVSINPIEWEEEEEHTLKANVNVDTLEVIEAKIEQLRTDAEIIENKRNRMEWQMFNLNSKANKLEEVLETIKEFE